MFLDNLLPSFTGALAAPGIFLRRLRHPRLISFGLLANLAAMRKKSIINGIDSVWDIGANQGQFAYMAHSVWPELPIYSFEPDPVSFARLEDTFSKFSIPGKTFNLGLGAEDGQRELVRHADSVNNSFLQNGRAEIALTDKVTVQCVTLDKLATEIGASGAAFLKLDVQGYELAVLAGAQSFLQRCRYVLAEVSFKPCYQHGAHADEVMLEMRKHGFTCIQILDVLRDGKSGHILEADILFMNMGKASI